MNNVMNIINDIVGEYQKKLPDMDIEECIDTGLQIAPIIKALTSIQDGIKVRLREEALQRSSHQPGTVSLRPDRCLVQIMKPKTVIRNGADMTTLQMDVGPEFWSLFEEVVTYKVRPDFSENLPDISPTSVTEVMKVLEMKEDSPKVFFKG